MNKRELIARVQRHMGAGASRNSAQAAVNAVLDSILQGAAEEEKIHIAKLGTFEYRKRRGLRRLCFRPARRLNARTIGHCQAQPAPDQTIGRTKNGG